MLLQLRIGIGVGVRQDFRNSDVWEEEVRLECWHLTCSCARNGWKILVGGWIVRLVWSGGLELLCRKAEYVSFNR